MKSSILLFAVCVFAVTQAAKPSVQIYYEALCPDSLKFMNKQFYPAYFSLKDEFDVELVPFGFAKMSESNGTYHFTCQHGTNECYANKYHACAIHEYPGDLSVKFIDCGMETGRPHEDSIMQWCARKFSISFDKLQTCYKNGEADKLLAQCGTKTNSVTPKITFIPTVTFNGKFDQKLQDESIKDFRKVICQLISGTPKGCTF